jgi:hypothetical protein
VTTWSVVKLVPPGETLIVPAPAGRTEVDRVLGTCGSKGLVNSRSWQAVKTNTKNIKLPKLYLEEKIELTKEELDNKIEQVSKLPGPKGESIKGDPGEPGKDYILTEEDIDEIASKIEVPIVEKVIEKTEVVHEQPIVEQKIEVKEVAVTDEPEVIAEKLNTLEGVIDSSVIKGLLTIDDIKGKLDISDIKNGVWNQPGKGKLDQRWHGGGVSEFIKLKDV